MPKVKIIYNKEGCIGAGACQVVAPKYWKLQSDGKAELLGGKENLQTKQFELEAEVSDEEFVALKESAESCPVQVIKVIQG